jgi:glutamate:Na+ symporter, ESS family
MRDNRFHIAWFCILAGFVGMGLDATPVAIANMDAVTARFGPSTKAFLVVPLVGASFLIF